MQMNYTTGKTTHNLQVKLAKKITALLCFFMVPIIAEGTKCKEVPDLKWASGSIGFMVNECFQSMNKIIFILMIFVAYSQDFDELYFGSDDAFDIVTWNIEWFPKNGTVTVDYVSEIIKALDADILAIQEVDNIQLFEY